MKAKKRTNYRWIILWLFAACFAMLAITLAQIKPAQAKYVYDYTFTDHQFKIVNGDAWTQQGPVNEGTRTGDNSWSAHGQNQLYRIPRTGYYAFMVLGGRGGKGGEGSKGNSWYDKRGRSMYGEAGRASGVASMTANHWIGGVVASGGRNGDNDQEWSWAGGISNGTSAGNRGDGYREGGGGGGASYLMYRSSNSAWATSNQFACAGGGGGGGGNRHGGNGPNPASGYPMAGGAGGVIDGAGNASGGKGEWNNDPNASGSGGVYNGMGVNNAASNAGGCSHGSAGVGRWQCGGDARGGSTGGGGGSGFPGGGGGTQGCNEDYAGNGGGGGASVVQSNASGLGSISKTPSNILTCMTTICNGLRTGGGEGDNDRQLSGSAAIAFVGYRDPATYMLN